MGTERESHYVQSLERGLIVISAFGAGHPELTPQRRRPRAPS